MLYTLYLKLWFLVDFFWGAHCSSIQACSCRVEWIERCPRCCLLRCANLLKLPDYTSYQSLKTKVLQAIRASVDCWLNAMRPCIRVRTPVTAHHKSRRFLPLPCQMSQIDSNKFGSSPSPLFTWMRTPTAARSSTRAQYFAFPLSMDTSHDARCIPAYARPNTKSANKSSTLNQYL